MSGVCNVSSAEVSCSQKSPEEVFVDQFFLQAIKLTRPERESSYIKNLLKELFQARFTISSRSMVEGGGFQNQKWPLLEPPVGIKTPIFDEMFSLEEYLSDLLAAYKTPKAPHVIVGVREDTTPPHLIGLELSSRNDWTFIGRASSALEKGFLLRETLYSKAPCNDLEETDLIGATYYKLLNGLRVIWKKGVVLACDPGTKLKAVINTPIGKVQLQVTLDRETIPLMINQLNSIPFPE